MDDVTNVCLVKIDMRYGQKKRNKRKIGCGNTLSKS